MNNGSEIGAVRASIVLALTIVGLFGIGPHERDPTTLIVVVDVNLMEILMLFGLLLLLRLDVHAAHRLCSILSQCLGIVVACL